MKVDGHQELKGGIWAWLGRETSILRNARKKYKYRVLAHSCAVFTV
jgi:hypothetical protein